MKSPRLWILLILVAQVAIAGFLAVDIGEYGRLSEFLLRGRNYSRMVGPLFVAFGSGGYFLCGMLFRRGDPRNLLNGAYLSLLFLTFALFGSLTLLEVRYSLGNVRLAILGAALLIIAAIFVMGRGLKGGRG